MPDWKNMNELGFTLVFTQKNLKEIINSEEMSGWCILF